MTKILIGLCVLSVMVFIHEAGHFIVARLCGVVVESFSIGWGPVLFRKKWGQTEYRISLIPIGGYCGMKGESAFRQALEEKLTSIPKEEGGLYSASPFKRILIAFAGPFANYISAVFCFAIISAMGSVYYTTSNMVAPLHFYEKDVLTSAKEAKLEIGDKILEVNGKKTDTFYDIMKAVVVAANVKMPFKIERNGSVFTQEITPKLNPKTGAGVIGIYPFVPLSIDFISPSSIADKAGLLKGDEIKSIEGKDIYNTIDLQEELRIIANAEKESFTLGFERRGKMQNASINIVKLKDGSIDLGLGFKKEKIVVAGTSFFRSIIAGFVQTHETIMLTFKGFILLFKGVDLKQAVSGPLRITHMIGDVAQEGFKMSLAEGFRGILSFISIISISLFIMNLLPIPVLDGGLILLSFIEAVMRREISPKVTYRVQFIGFAFIAILFVFALTADIMFLAG